VHDEKLGAVGIRPGIGHGDGASGVFTGDGLIGKLVAGAAGAVTLGIATLDHEAFKDPVEDRAVVEVFLSQIDKVIGGNGGIFNIQVDGDLSD